MKNFWFYTVLVCCVIALTLGIQKCATDPYQEQPVKEVVTEVDTVYIKLHDTFYTTPKLVYSKPVIKYVEGQMATSGCEGLNVFSDTLRTEHGYVATNDSVQNNHIIGRGWVANLLVPKITETNTVTIREQPRRQLYFNYGISAGYMPSTTLWTADVVAGFSYKDRKDRITTLNRCCRYKRHAARGIDYVNQIKCEKEKIIGYGR